MLPTEADNTRTALELMAAPDTWVEAYPRVPLDEGSVGGDIQDGPAWSRRFVLWHPGTGLCVVLNVAHYVAMEDDLVHLPWIQRQTEWIVCRDFVDPGGTEEYADYAYLDLHEGRGGRCDSYAALTLTREVTIEALPLGQLWDHVAGLLAGWST